MQALTVRLHQLGQAALMDRGLARRDQADLVGVDIAQGHRVAQRRETHTRHEADVAGTDDTNA